jgi:hypothetical protein
MGAELTGKHKINEDSGFRHIAGLSLFNQW